MFHHPLIDVPDFSLSPPPPKTSHLFTGIRQTTSATRRGGLLFGPLAEYNALTQGAWRNKEVHERLSDMQIVMDLHPGEASWQAFVIENTIGVVKDTMTRIVLERPEHKSSEVSSSCVGT